MEDKNADHAWLDATLSGASRGDAADAARADRPEPAARQLSSLAEWRRERAARREARNVAS